jgi:hypothetical protein
MHDTSMCTYILAMKQQEEQHERDNYLREAGLTLYHSRP